MPDRIRRTIPINDDLSVILYEEEDPRNGTYISIKHITPKRNMEGEALVGPSDIPALVKALTEAALELTSSAYWHAGRDEGVQVALK